jgi:mannose-6-phosphate isomerase-like protein (cupin superfamily)
MKARDFISSAIFAALAATSPNLGAQAPAVPPVAPSTDAQAAKATTYSGGLPALDVSAAQVKAFIDGLPKNAITDSAIRTTDVGGYRVGVFGVFRPKNLPGDAIAHETRTTEIYYMLEGAGTLVTGGTITGIKPAPAGRAAGPRGDKIDGGVSRHVGPGDIIIIPGRAPHWWSSLDSDIRYLIFRPDPDGRLPLK